MSDLPAGWDWSTVGELCDLVRGVSFKKAESSSSEQPGTLPIIRAGNLSDGGIDFDHDLLWVPQERVSADQRLRQGDIVVATSSGSIKVVGKSVHLRTDWNGAHGAFMSVLRPSADIDAAFAGWYVRSPAVRSQWSDLAKGTNINNLKKGHLEDTQIPVPPLPEQRRIVAAIEEHFSRLDAAEVDLRSALARTTLLMQATLIATIPCTVVPDDWEITTVDKAGATDLGRQRAPKYHSGESMRPYLRVANVFEDRLDLSDVMEMDFDDEAWAKYRLVKKDILLNEGQSPHLVGRPAMYHGDPESVAFTNSLIRFQAHDDVDPEWALLVFRRHLHARRFMKEASITTNIAHLALKRFRTVEFPKPPLPEQRRLVTKIRSDLDSIDRVRVEIGANLKRVAAARRSILAAAFSGQLVPQDPSDEPADVLLKRIAAERAASKPSRRKKAAS